MKITRFETFLVPPRWCFLKIETDTGICGWGEPIVEGRAAATAQTVVEMSDYLIGKDPGTIEDHWTVLYRGGYYRGGALHMSALAGIDQALWDIHGQRLGQPVHKLLGGPVRSKVRVYSSIFGTNIEDLRRQARQLVDHGLTLIKMNAVEGLGHFAGRSEIDAAVARIAAVRDEIGPHIGLGIDIHGRVHKAQLKSLLSELEQFNLAFIEEPVLSENAECLSELSAFTSAPIALGERLYSRWDFKNILAAAHVDIIQPDPSHAGGITETRKIAAMAECHDVAVALHCPLGPIALAANLQLAAVCHNIQLQEQRLNLHLPEAKIPFLKDQSAFEYRDGFTAIPSGHGLGVTPDEDAIRLAARNPHRWRNPVWRQDDGSFVEW